MNAAPRPTIAFIAYSRDEADLLEGCLERAVGFDEVIVCDMESTDATAEVAARFGARRVPVPDARVIESVRQLGLAAATATWVLFVDADERLPAGFADRLRSLLSSVPSDVAAVRLRYRNVAFGRPLRHTLTGMRKCALLDRVRTQYPEEARAHQEPAIDGTRIDAPDDIPPVLHLSFRTLDQSIEKYLRYAHDLEAPATLSSPIGALRAIARATIFGGTWRDGRAGFAVSFLDAVGFVYAALLESERRGELADPFDEHTSRPLALLTGAHKALTDARAKLRAMAAGRRH